MKRIALYILMLGLLTSCGREVEYRVEIKEGPIQLRVTDVATDSVIQKTLVKGKFDVELIKGEKLNLLPVDEIRVGSGELSFKIVTLLNYNVDGYENAVQSILDVLDFIGVSDPEVFERVSRDLENFDLDVRSGHPMPLFTGGGQGLSDKASTMAVHIRLERNVDEDGYYWLMQISQESNAVMDALSSQLHLEGNEDSKSTDTNE